MGPESTVVRFTGNVPKDVQDLLSNPVNSSDTTIKIDEVISTLKTAMNYRNKITIINFSDVFEKFEKINANQGKKQQIHELISKVLLGSGSDTNPQEADEFIEKEFPDNSSWLYPSHSKQLSLVCQLVSLPESCRHSQLVKNCMNLYSTVPPNVFEFINKHFITIKDDIIKAIGLIPASKLNNTVIIKIIKLFLLIDNSKSSELILNAIKTIPEDQRGNIINRTTDLCTDLFTDRTTAARRVHILNHISKIPDKEWENVLLYSDPLINRDASGLYKAEMYEFINSIPRIERKDFSDNSLLLFKWSSSYELNRDKLAILRGIKRILPTYRSVAVERVILFLGENRTRDSILDIILLVSVMYPVTENDQTHFYLKLQNLFDLLETKKNKIDFLAMMKKISWEERQGVFELSEPFFERLPKMDSKLRLIDAVCNIPASERRDVMKQATPFLNVTTEMGGLRVIAAIATVPPPRDEFVKLIAPLTQGISDGERLEGIIETLLRIHPNQRQGVIAKTALNLKELSDNFSLEQFMLIIATIPLEERTDDTCRLIIKILIKEEYEEWFLYALKIIVPERRVQVLKLAAENNDIVQDTHEYKILSKIFGKIEDIKQSTHAHLLVLLEDAYSDRIKAQDLSTDILTHADILYIDPNDKLFQRAIEIQIISSGENLTDKKNPYRLYKDLKEKAKQEFTPFDPPLYTKTLKDKSKSVEIGLNLEFLRKYAREKKGFTISDLPTGITPTTLKDLFEKIEKRVESLPTEPVNLKKQTLDYIQNTFKCSLNEMKENLLEKPLIPRLLSIKGSPDDPIENTAVYFYAILMALQDASSNFVKDSPLTEQETLLMTIAATIRECITGQRDGIIEYANQLDVKYRIGRKTGESNYVETIQALMEGSIQKTLKDVFLGQKFLEAATGIKEDFVEIETENTIPKIKQASHQTQYLENKLAHEIGMVHAVNFDSSTQVIYDVLIDMPIEKALDLYFNECTPDLIINQFKRDLIHTIESENRTIEIKLAKDLADYKEKVLQTVYEEKWAVNKKLLQIRKELQPREQKLRNDLELYKSDNPKINEEISLILKKHFEEGGLLSDLVGSNKIISQIPEFSAIPLTSTQMAIKDYLESKSSDYKLTKELDKYKNQDKEIVKHIDHVLGIYQKEPTGLINLVMTNNVLGNTEKFSRIPTSKTEIALNQYLAEKLPDNIKARSGWESDYELLDEDTYRVKGLTDLGAIELLRTAGYLLMKTPT